MPKGAIDELFGSISEPRKFRHGHRLRDTVKLLTCLGDEIRTPLREAVARGTIAVLGAVVEGNYYCPQTSYITG
jgi:hypothetical protein